MAKTGKSFSNLGKSNNLRGFDALIESPTIENTESKVEKKDLLAKKSVGRPVGTEPYITKTFNINTKDFNFMEDFRRYKRKQTGDEFGQREALEEAFACLRKKYPQVEIKDYL